MTTDIVRLTDSPEPWTRYRTLIDLRGFAIDDPEVVAARKATLSHPLVHGILTELSAWPEGVLNSHKSSSQPYHKLAFLADVGLTCADPGIGVVAERILATLDGDGVPTLTTKHAVGVDAIAGWALCDAPITMRALVAFGYGDHPGLRKGIDALFDRCRDNGWPCALSASIGTWRGPGRKQDPCPFSTLAMLRLAAERADTAARPEAAAGVEALLGLWERSRAEHPYMFYMGTDFRKLKVPFVWYDIMQVADTLSRYPFTRADARFADMLEVIAAKAGPDGIYAPESDWKAWSDGGFSAKGRPSDWLTFLVVRLMRRAGRS
ncbi:MAG: hypothetical protein WC509_01390 [Candidatus Izemoplasmatales bacterium]